MFQFFILFSIISIVVSECPKHSVKWQKNCYFFERRHLPFVKAEMACNNLEGHLASVHDGFANAFLAQYGILSFNDTKTFWIGITDLIVPGNWSWTDGSGYGFSEWRNSKPGGGQKCGALRIEDARWDMDQCFEEKPFVCKIRENWEIPPLCIPPTMAPILTSTEIPEGNCAVGWSFFSGFCYLLTSPQPTWKAAQEICINENSTLTSIQNEEELKFVQNLRSGLFKWIGLYSEGNVLEWKWLDGTPVNYAPWASGLPQNGNETCAIAYDEFRNDWNCDRGDLYAVCKKLSNV